MAKSKREIPIFNGSIIETHCHLDYLKDRPLEETLKICLEKNIKKIVTISVSPDNLDYVVELAKTNPNVFCTQGIHPHQAKEWHSSVSEKIQKNLDCEKVVAIGEIGLDYYYSKSPRDQQIEAFNSQMTIACDYNKPVIIHSRDADQDTIEVLDNFKNSLKRRGVIHSFTSGPKLAEKALEEGFYLGFNGIITFKNAENVREIVTLCPIEQILLETDAPFLTPIPYRGKENAPFYLPFVAEKIAELKNLEVEEVIAITTKNASDLFLFENR